MAEKVLKVGLKESTRVSPFQEFNNLVEKLIDTITKESGLDKLVDKINKWLLKITRKGKR